MSLHNKITEIDNAVINDLKEITFSQIDERFSELKIIHGRRERGRKFRQPVMPVMFGNASINHSGSSIAEEWVYPFSLVSLIIGRDAETDRKHANEIVLLASDELTQDRNLRGTVRDLVRTSYVPADDRSETSKHLFGSAVELEARFKYRT